jgi:hypothetical protein
MENAKTKQELEQDIEDQKLVSRRDFLSGLRKWSAAVIGVAIAGAVLVPGKTASGWVNGRGGWVNGAGGGGGSWANRGATWANRGAAWANRAGGGGGGSWVNRRGW